MGFWTANPENNEGVGLPLDAQYAWEEGEQYSIFKPTLGEGLMPIPKKLGRGLANSLFGIAELPGQVFKGDAKGNVIFRLGRGIWFWLSREVYGFGGVAICLVPNPKDNPGYPFDGKWAWSALAE